MDNCYYYYHVLAMHVYAHIYTKKSVSQSNDEMERWHCPTCCRLFIWMKTPRHVESCIHSLIKTEFQYSCVHACISQPRETKSTLWIGCTISTICNFTSCHCRHVSFVVLLCKLNIAKQHVWSLKFMLRCEALLQFATFVVECFKTHTHKIFVWT